VEDCFLSDPVTSIGGTVFSHRQMDIISCIVNGVPDKEIERLLGISVDTIRTHVKNITKKDGFDTRDQIRKNVESSDNHRKIKERYVDLLIFSKFQEMLKKVRESKILPKYKCVVHVIDTGSVDKYILLSYLK